MVIQYVIKEDMEDAMPTPTTSSSVRRFSISPTLFNNEVSNSEVESNPERVVARGYGLSTGLAGQPNSFKLDARDAGFGDFDVVIKGASRATIEYLEEEEALYKIKYHVVQPGEYQIEIKYDLKHIPGSPFTAKVLDPTSIENQNKLDCSSTYTNSIENQNKLDCSSTYTNSMESFSSINETSDDEASNNGRTLPINASIQTPSGNTVTGTVIQKPNGKITVKFPREETGQYIVTLRHKKSGALIRGSPYEVMIRTKEISTTMTAYGTGLKEAGVDTTNCFTVFGTKSIDINNVCIMAYGVDATKLKVFQNDWDSIDILYEVKRSGLYFFHIHENGQNIPGSPFPVSTKIDNTNNKSANGLSSVIITIWHGRESSDYRVKTELTSLDGQCLSHSVTKRGRHLLEVRFLPPLNGNYKLEVFKNDPPLQQYFNIVVDNLPPNNQEVMIRMSGDGLHSAVVMKHACVFIDSSMPPLRSFSVEFDGPSTVEIAQRRSEDGRCIIEYIGHLPGRYVMSIKYDGFHVGKSPFYINMLSSDTITTGAPLAIENKTLEADATMCNAFGKGLHNSQVGETSSFTVDTTKGGDGGLMAGFTGSSTLTEVMCKNIGNFLYNVQYTISQVGTYKLSVLWDGGHIPGSPFSINVHDENNNN